MCGYCIEGIMLILHGSGEKWPLIPDPQGLFSGPWLQEGGLAQTMDVIKRDKSGQLVDIALCRLYDQYINAGFSRDIFERIKSSAGRKSILLFFERRRNFRDDLWSRLGDSSLYEKKEDWEEFITLDDKLYNASSELLNLYYDWWIKGVNLKTYDSIERLEQTGLMDPIDNTAKQERQKFKAIFPAVCFALLFMIRYHCSSEIITRIALGIPRGIPDFTANDLWLQRRAFVACVNQMGMPFILENFKKIRLELIYYTLLKLQIETSALHALKTAILAADNHRTDYIEPEVLLKLMDSRMNYNVGTGKD